ncbi:MAG: hypothetical protein HOJ31_10330 [Anaerolineae bacterium]|jgi:hypothetical protein|nr:hypothetical protein [Anaerolineae bacterium]
MAYTAPITDRTIADILAENSKAFFNVADWVRVYGNSSEVNTALTTALGITISFDTITAKTTKDIDTASQLNALLANIERMRLWLATYAPIADNDFIEIKDSWLGGFDNPSPDYTHVNTWEKVMDIIYQIYKSPYTVTRSPRTGVAGCGSGITRNNLFRG